jgi:hypothetical protein
MMSLLSALPMMMALMIIHNLTNTVTAQARPGGGRGGRGTGGHLAVSNATPLLGLALAHGPAHAVPCPLAASPR